MRINAQTREGNERQVDYFITGSVLAIYLPQPVELIGTSTDPTLVPQSPQQPPAATADALLTFSTMLFKRAGIIEASLSRGLIGNSDEPVLTLTLGPEAERDVIDDQVVYALHTLQRELSGTQG